ncbi:MAG TPA: thioredoxin domain-containing protein [Myxococcota bacterium]|nr:thioredoxin domain-containing protein [Myxococcota bacterium]
MNDSRSARARRALSILLAIAGAHTAWALFQWYQLIVARRGGDVVCVGGGHCADIWSSPFASTVHARTGLPVAAWGVVWGLAAFALPLVARVRLSRRRAADAWLGATLLTALAGVVGAAVLLSASLAFGHLCTTCALTYLLVLGYFGVAFVGLGLPLASQLARGAPLALAAVGLGAALLYFPGTRTPQSMAETGAKALQSLPSGTPDEREVLSFINTLPDPAKQLLSDTLAAYAAGPVVTLPPARTTIGPQSPRLVLTEFTDTLCSHCAQMHEVLKELRLRFGADAFSLAPHQYPLDSGCNPAIKGASNPVRCLAARVQICAEGAPNEFEFVGSLFENQTTLSEDKVWELAQVLGPRAEVEACAKSPETEKKLQDDIAWAQAHGIQGTPFLFIGGRQAIAFPPLIYVLALTRGAPSHPLYASLPPPQPLPWNK